MLYLLHFPTVSLSAACLYKKGKWAFPGSIKARTVYVHPHIKCFSLLPLPLFRLSLSFTMLQRINVHMH
jgi:hypothetical protein